MSTLLLNNSRSALKRAGGNVLFRRTLRHAPKLALGILNPVVVIIGRLFWQFESMRARLQTAVSNEEAGR